MVSRRSFLVSATSVAGAVGLAGCTNSPLGPDPGPQAPDYTRWLPDTELQQLSVDAQHLSAIADLEDTEIAPSQPFLGVAPADIDLYLTIRPSFSPLAPQYTAVEGSFTAEDVSTELRSQLSAEVTEQDDYRQYQRLSAEQVEAGITEDQLAITQGTNPSTLEAMLDARDDEGPRLIEAATRLERLATALGDRDRSQLQVLLEDSSDTEANNSTETSPSGQQVGAGTGYDIGAETTTLTRCELYSTADAADPDNLRTDLTESYGNETLDIRTTDGLVTATVEIPTSSLTSNS